MKIQGIRFYPYALTPEQRKEHYEATRLLYMKWWERLIFWAKVTWRILIGKEAWVRRYKSNIPDYWWLK